MPLSTAAHSVQVNGTSKHVNGISNGERLNGVEQEYDLSAPESMSSHTRERSYNAPPSSFSIPKQSSPGVTSPNGIADFFSQEVFRIVLHNPATAHRLLKFTQARMCGENMEFLEKVDRYNALLDELMTILTDIHQSYTSNEAPKQIGTPSTILNRLNVDIKTHATSTLPSMEHLFVEAQENVESILRTAVYPRFVKYQMTNSASRALSTDRQKYQGLGDCFCLTDPSKADNPIIYASDGFIGVTGYGRPEVIPRNCRFLQGNQTDRVATRRLRESIDNKEETVELLLNYKKSGEPFWNLLYVAPLFDVNGQVVFYIGGQINCSTTIRSNTDVLRILSASDDLGGDQDAIHQRQKSSSKKTFMNLVRKASMKRISKSSAQKVEVREPGMEQGLLKQIERLNFRTQMEKFYTAYSKYLLVKYSDFVIQHYSRGLADALGITTDTDQYFVGNNIFKILAQHASSFPRDLKAKVKEALRNGQPISTGLDILTISRMNQTWNDERFFTHWTPVKDEHGQIGYVVMTLSSSLYA